MLFPAERLSLKWERVSRVGAGLHNLGNTCFLNATVQCLTYTPPLANYLLSKEHGRSCEWGLGPGGGVWGSSTHTSRSWAALSTPVCSPGHGCAGVRPFLPISHLPLPSPHAAACSPLRAGAAFLSSGSSWLCWDQAGSRRGCWPPWAERRTQHGPGGTCCPGWVRLGTALSRRPEERVGLRQGLPRLLTRGLLQGGTCGLFAIFTEPLALVVGFAVPCVVSRAVPAGAVCAGPRHLGCSRALL